MIGTSGYIIMDDDRNSPRWYMRITMDEDGNLLRGYIFMDDDRNSPRRYMKIIMDEDGNQPKRYIVMDIDGKMRSKLVDDNGN